MEKSSAAYDEYVRNTIRQLKEALREGKITQEQYDDTVKTLTNGTDVSEG